jgi:peptidyl-tRNA hydrolase
MQAFLAALVGGLLTIAGGLAAVLVTGRGMRNQWRNDTQLKVGTEVLGALQNRVSSINDLAYLADKNSDAGKKAWLVQCAAATEWNNARHTALLISPAMDSCGTLKSF